MDAVVNLLLGYNWSRLCVYEDGYAKPVLQYQTWKAMVGKVWTTIWCNQTIGSVEEMQSVRTEDLGAVEEAIKGVVGVKTGKKARKT